MREEREYTYARTSVYRIDYHIIWCVKYRRKVLCGAAAEFLIKSLYSIGEEKGFKVKEAWIEEEDHVHVRISAPPKHSITFLVKHLKGISAFRLLREFPEIKELLWNGDLWNGSYFVESSGSEDKEEAERYINRQKKVQR